MSSLSQMLSRSLAGAVITAAAFSAGGCSMICHAMRGSSGCSAHVQNKCGACKGKCAGSKSTGGCAAN